MSHKLAGKIALITGGSSGLGLATAQRFVAEGAHVFITGRRQAELDAASKQIGGNVIGIRSDVSSLGDLDHLFAAIKEKKGRLDVLFANAGGGAFVPLEQVTEKHFDKYFGINVKGTLFTVQKAVPLMTAGGAIVINGSMVSIKGLPAFGVYAATKAALRSFARTWTQDLRGRNIRVNVVSPGTIVTPGYKSELGMTDEQIEGFKAEAAATIDRSAAPAHRMKSPRPWSSSSRTTPATSMASNYSSMGARHKSETHRQLQLHLIMSQKLSTKVALVIGGSRGLGVAIALALAEEGANVAISYVSSAEKAAAVVRQLEAKGVTAAAFQTDQGDPSKSEPLIQEVVKRFGRLDILVNNAAVAYQAKTLDAADIDNARLDQMWMINVAGVIANIRAAAKVLPEGGRIVSIGSGLATRVGFPGAADYAGTKAAVVGYSKGAARDLAPRGITVNVVQAGMMDTEMTTEAGRVAKIIFPTLSIQRFGRLEEIAAGVVFLASPEASYITGTVLNVEGGYGA